MEERLSNGKKVTFDGTKIAIAIKKDLIVLKENITKMI